MVRIVNLLIFLLLLTSSQIAMAISPSNWVVLLKDPWRLSGAIADAVFSGVARHVTNMEIFTYYENALGISPAHMPLLSRDRPNFCTSETVALALSPTGTCNISGFSTECKNINGCALIKVHPSLLGDESLRKVIIRSVTDPCTQLRNPDSFGSNTYDSHMKGANYSARWSWLALSCDGTKLKPEIVTLDEKAGIIQLSF